MKHVMVDIETLGTNYDAVILSIGAVKFGPKEGIIDKEKTFYRNISLISTMDIGLTVSADTIRWWFDQSSDAREKLKDPETVPIKDALESFTAWFSGSNYLWANGTTFDPVILQTAYNRCDLHSPWHYTCVRDMRTIIALAKDLRDYKKPKNEGVKHNALADALWQAECLIDVYQQFGTPDIRR